MGKFWIGFAVAIVMVFAGEFIYVRFGFVDPRADIKENSLEKGIAMPALDSAVDRRASEMKDPVPPSDENLIEGMKLYQANCSSCHGDIHQPEGIFAEALYPRAPQFLKEAPDMPENQNFYIIEHGIRMSGMPAWGKILGEEQRWQLTTFLSHMDKLPSNVATQWKETAAGSGEGTSSK